MVILLIATGTGLVRGWDHIDLRVDFMNVLYPLLCFYLCANVLDTRQKIYRMLGVLFLTSVIDACLLDAYYLLGHGWPYSDENAGFERIVTYNATDLMVFIAMIITIYSVSTSGILTGWRRVFAVVGCLPMVFAVLFSLFIRNRQILSSDHSNAQLDYPAELREAFATWACHHEVAGSPWGQTWGRQFLLLFSRPNKETSMPGKHYLSPCTPSCISWPSVNSPAMAQT